MPFSVISNFAFNPALAQEYAQAAFVESLRVLDKAIGIITNVDIASLKGQQGPMAGEFFDIPKFGTIASLIARRDLTATGAPTDLDLTGITGKAVILRRMAGPVKFTEDIFVRGVSVEEAHSEIGKQIGNKAAQEMRERAIGFAIAAIGAIDTPTANCHIIDNYSTSAKVNATITGIHSLRMLLKDKFAALTTLVMHSEAFADLFADGIANYKIENIGGAMLASGFTDPSLMGLKILVVDDASLKIDNGGDYKKYKTLVFGQGALALLHQRNIRIDSEKRLDFVAPYHRVLGNYDYAIYMPGMKYTDATANPAAATLETVANHDEHYTDHREVLAAYWQHNSSAA